MAKLILQNQTEPASPDVGCTTLYVDSDDGKAKVKNSNGCINDIACTDNVIDYVNCKLCDFKYSKKANILIVGGGAPGTDRNTTSGAGIGGGGGAVCYICNYILNSINIISVGGPTSDVCCTNATPGKPTCFNNIYVRGGCGYGISGNGNGEGTRSTYSTGGAGGAGGPGCNSGGSWNNPGMGGDGYESDILGYTRYFGAGGGGTSTCGANAGNYLNGGKCGGGHGGGRQGYNATCRGGGGGNGDWVGMGGDGYQGVVIISYPIGCGYDFIGGRCVYCCNGNKIHIFDEYDSDYYLIENLN